MTNLARAFAIFGVMSIVRFRASAGKEYSVAFIFMSVALGMCCGAGYYTLAVLYCLFAVFVMFLINTFFTKKKNKSPDKPSKEKPSKEQDQQKAAVRYD